MDHITSSLALLLSEHLEDENCQHIGYGHPRNSYGSSASDALKAAEFIPGPGLFDAGKSRYHRDAYTGKCIEEIRPPLSLQEVTAADVRWDLLLQQACDLALVILAFSTVGISGNSKSYSSGISEMSALFI